MGWGGRIGDLALSSNAGNSLLTCISAAGNAVFVAGSEALQYQISPGGAIPIQAPHLLKGLLRQPNNVSRCQLRGGVHLDEGYVNDVCLTPRFNQCVFYEDELTKS